jgi:hypothetical protein
LVACDTQVPSKHAFRSHPPTCRAWADGITAIAAAKPKAASKAFDLAAQQIDKLIDPSTPNEERKTRKRRLLKGPKEFRDVRGDTTDCKQ